MPVKSSWTTDINAANGTRFGALAVGGLSASNPFRPWPGKTLAGYQLNGIRLSRLTPTTCSSVHRRRRKRSQGSPDRQAVACLVVSSSVCVSHVPLHRTRRDFNDEPASALDPISRWRLKPDHELKKDYTVVTHNMQQAARVADKTAFFNLQASGAGQTHQYDDTTTIFNNLLISRPKITFPRSTRGLATKAKNRYRLILVVGLPKLDASWHASRRGRSKRLMIWTRGYRSSTSMSHSIFTIESYARKRRAINTARQSESRITAEA